jgi:hypothetical protein
VEVVANARLWLKNPSMKKDEINIEVLWAKKPGVTESPCTAMNFGGVSILRWICMNNSALMLDVSPRSLRLQPTHPDKANKECRHTTV